MMPHDSCLQGCLTDVSLGANLPAAETCFAQAGCHPGAVAACARVTGPQTPTVVDSSVSTGCGFSEVRDSRFISYDCNPVLLATEESFAHVMHSASVWAEPVFGHPQFHALYSASRTESGQAKIGYAHSLDGANFEPWATNPVIPRSDIWSGTLTDYLNVSPHPLTGELWMSWRGWDQNTGEYGVGAAHSVDATSWDVEPHPAFDMWEVPGGISPCYPADLAYTSGEIRAVISARSDTDRCELYETSGAPWSLHTPISLGEPDDYDAGGVMSSALVSRSDGLFLFYVGIESWDPDGTPRGLQLALATSTDGGRSWKKSLLNPITGISNRSEGLVTEVHASAVGDEIHVWTRDWYDDLQANGYGWFIYEPHRVVH